MSEQVSPTSGKKPSAFLHRRGRWWVATAVLLAVCVATILWFGRVVLIPLRVIDPGESWTDRWGTTYTVISRQTVDRVGAQTPSQGAVFLRYVVQIDNYSIGYDLGEPSTDPLDTTSIPISTSSFELMGDQGQYWKEADIKYPAGEESLADWTERPVLRSQQLVTYFEVPTAQVDHVVGLVDRGDRRSPHRFPIIR